MFPGEGTDHIGEEFLDDAEADVGAHGDAEAYGGVAGRFLT